ncbi:hypothetical protein EMCG_00466 [[Emmonsia] crescens]|uniref:Uncharacterized protein n=1 Tax=[Emmonsia] crescens TaxID=73230 RepID=A0A0G2J8F7_9EURO|nr:hypothetical protein EMCG_00466 [Emmonsia crescens UAMH 3008]
MEALARLGGAAQRTSPAQRPMPQGFPNIFVGGNRPPPASNQPPQSSPAQSLPYHGSPQVGSSSQGTPRQALAQQYRHLGTTPRDITTIIVENYQFRSTSEFLEWLKNQTTPEKWPSTELKWF